MKSPGLILVDLVAFFATAGESGGVELYEKDLSPGKAVQIAQTTELRLSTQ